MVETEASGVGGFSERLKERIAVRLMDSPPPRYKLPWRSTYAQKCASALLDTGVAKASQLRVNFTLVWQELRWDYLEHAEFGRPFPETSDLARIANAMLDAAISVPQDSKFAVMTWRDALLILDLAMREHCKAIIDAAVAEGRRDAAGTQPRDAREPISRLLNRV